jgi:hypothetical protein
MPAAREFRTVSATALRNQVVRRWGTPQATMGSVNEPREREEHGHRYNEKWVYRLTATAPDEPIERVIYWLRYDLVAAYLVRRDGVAVPDDLASALRSEPDRRYVPADARAAD